MSAKDKAKDIPDQSKHSAANNLHMRKTFNEKQATLKAQLNCIFGRENFCMNQTESNAQAKRYAKIKIAFRSCNKVVKTRECENIGENLRKNKATR